MRSLVVFCSLYLTFSVGHLAVAAQPPPMLNVDEAVRQAIRNNPRLSASTRDVLAAQQGSRAARALANPQIVFAPALTGVGSDTEALIQQPLELNGTRAARADAAQARLRATIADSTTALRDLVFDTKAVCYGLARARGQFALSQDLLRASQEFDSLTRQGVELGSRPAVEQIQSGIEVIRARQQVTLAQSQADRAQAALDTLMGRSPEIPVQALAPLPTVFTPVDHDASLRQALAARTDITSAEATAQALGQDARGIRAEGLPDLAPQYRATSVTRGFHDAGFGIGLTLPLLDYGSRRGRMRQAEEAARAQEDRATALRAQVRQEVEQAISQVQASDTVLADYPQGLLGQARGLLDASRLGYQEGKTSIVSLLEAQRTYRAVENESIDAQVNAVLARAELERAAGSFPPTALIEKVR